MSKFNTPYDLRVHNVDLKQRPFELLEDVFFKSPDGYEITVPKGYRTDFASVPRFFHRVVNPMGRHGKAAIVHDWLCDENPHTMNHKVAAKIFGDAMKELGVPFLRRWSMRLAVRVVGPKFQG